MTYGEAEYLQIRAYSGSTSYWFLINLCFHMSITFGSAVFVVVIDV